MSARHEDRPFIAIWETTRACDLTCLHCRACARPERDTQELSTDEGKALLESFARAGVPLVVLTGGDPAKRPDLAELVRHGKSLGLVMGLTPSATPLVTPRLLESLAEAGLSRLAISVDAASAEPHDRFRGVDGSFDRSLAILAYAKHCGISTQINTSVRRSSGRLLPSIAELVADSGCVLWSVFYLVPTGRARADMLPDANEVEKSLRVLCEIAEGAPFGVKTTAAPHYRRVLVQRRRARGVPEEKQVTGRAAIRVNDGRGFAFVSHTGDVFPSGFLPIRCGNVREQEFIDIYRDHPVFRDLRNPELLHGKCGACEFKDLCGGSRARALAMNGDYLASDPLCAYVPPGWQEPKRRRLGVVNG
jgi:radical SAM protein